MNQVQQEVKPVSGFARKKFLEENGYEVDKFTNEFTGATGWTVSDPREKNPEKAVIATDRLQGEAVSKAIDLLGGM